MQRPGSSRLAGAGTQKQAKTECSCRHLLAAPHIGPHLVDGCQGGNSTVAKVAQKLAVVDRLNPERRGVHPALGAERFDFVDEALNRGMQFHNCNINGTIPILSTPRSHFSHPGLVF